MTLGRDGCRHTLIRTGRPGALRSDTPKQFGRSISRAHAVQFVYLSTGAWRRGRSDRCRDSQPPSRRLPPRNGASGTAHLLPGAMVVPIPLLPTLTGPVSDLGPVLYPDRGKVPG